MVLPGRTLKTAHDWWRSGLKEDLMARTTVAVNKALRDEATRIVEDAFFKGRRNSIQYAVGERYPGPERR